MTLSERKPPPTGVVSGPLIATLYSRIAASVSGGSQTTHAMTRAAHAADRTGHMILQTLYQQCIKNKVTFFDEYQVLDFIMTDGKVTGSMGSGRGRYTMATGAAASLAGKTTATRSARRVRINGSSSSRTTERNARLH